MQDKYKMNADGLTIDRIFHYLTVIALVLSL
jgi:hypothetical protein